MKLNLIRILQLLLITLLLSTPLASAGNKWDCLANRINSRGDKLPTARGHHDSDQDDDDEKDDDDCKSEKKCCGENSCQDKDDDDKK